MSHLLIKNGNGEPQQHPLEGESISIGRAPDNTVILDHDSVSGHHAEVARENEKFILRDLGSSNGTKLNGQSIQEHPLTDGDCIQFGPIEAKFIQGTPESAGAGASPLPEKTTAPVVKHEVKTLKSISSSLRHTAEKVMSGVSVAARLAALKAKIEKLKLVNLNAAYHALGEKCYESGLHREQFAQQFESIKALELQIEEKNKQPPAAENQTTTERMKRAGVYVVSHAEVAGLRLRKNQLHVELARSVINLETTDSSIDTEKAAIKKMTEEIQRSEGAVLELQRQLKLHSASGKFAKLWVAGGILIALVVCALILSHWETSKRNGLSGAPGASTHRDDSEVNSAFETIAKHIKGCKFNGRQSLPSVQFDSASRSFKLQYWPVGPIPPLEITVDVADLDLDRTTVEKSSGRDLIAFHTRDDVKAVEYRGSAPKPGTSSIAQPLPRDKTKMVAGFILWANSDAEAKEIVLAFETLCADYQK